MKYIQLIALIAVITSCGGQSQSDDINYGRITVDQAKELLAQDELIAKIDLRTPSEWEGGIIDGAQLIDFNAGIFEQNLPDLDKDKTYFIYCRSGGRSGKALKMMKAQGFDKVYELKGGYNAWSAQE